MYLKSIYRLNILYFTLPIAKYDLVSNSPPNSGGIILFCNFVLLNNA